MTQQILILSLFLLVITNSEAQSSRLTFPENAKLAENFQKAISVQTGEYYRLFSKDSATTKHYSTLYMLDKIDNDSDFHFIFLAEYWIAFHYKEIIPSLIERIKNKKEVGLTNSADLIIWDRIQAKQMNFYGHGLISNDDLFTVAGRANRLLTKITGENFGVVSMSSTQRELEALQQKWIKWLKELK